MLHEPLYIVFDNHQGHQEVKTRERLQGLTMPITGESINVLPA